MLEKETKYLIYAYSKGNALYEIRRKERFKNSFSKITFSKNICKRWTMKCQTCQNNWHVLIFLQIFLSSLLYIAIILFICVTQTVYIPIHARIKYRSIVATVAPRVGNFLRLLSCDGRDEVTVILGNERMRLYVRTIFSKLNSLTSLEC